MSLELWPSLWELEVKKEAERSKGGSTVHFREGAGCTLGHTQKCCCFCTEEPHWKEGHRVRGSKAGSEVCSDASTGGGSSGDAEGFTW